MSLFIWVRNGCVTTNRTGKVWVNFQLAYDLEGHDQSVLDVKAIEEDQFLTGAVSWLHVDC